MSIETPKVEETTPVVTKPVETTPEAPVETPAAAATTETPAEAVKDSEPTTAAQEPAKDEVVVEATPASEGTLGYKEPGFLKQFRFVKHFFWFSEEPISADALHNYIKAEKPEVAHGNAAWAQETGKGVLFYSKRAEDKTHPTGLILLHDATNVTKVGFSEFSFKIGSHAHKFEAANSKERDSWIVAIEKIVSESKDLKEDITGRESYKKTIEGYSFSPVIAGAATTAPKKSLDATTPAVATEQTPAEAAATDAAPSDEAKKVKEAEKAKKERSQSRKRNSVFGIFGKKDEDKEVKKEEKAEKKAEKEHIKEEKAEEKAEKKAEKEEAKEEKKLEAEHKKEEAKAEHDTSKAKEAAEAAAIAAVPASVAVAAEKHEEKKEEKHDEKSADESSPTSPTEKKSKRASVFGSLFQKSKVTSPTAEKTEKDAGPAVPAKDTEVPPVSETAPVIDEPIDTKPIDTAAVTAPVDAAIAAPAATEAQKDTTAAPVAAESATTPKTEKKGFLAGLIKKPAEKREEKKEEKAAEEIAKDPVAAAAVTDNTTTEATGDAAVKESETAKDERPAREKRRTSLFGSLGTLKRKGDKSPAPESTAAEGTTEAEVKDTKREKSPIPKLGGLFRKPSRAVKSDKPAEETKTDAPIADAAKTQTEAPKAEGEAAATDGTITVVEPQSEDTKIIGDVVPDELHATVHDAVTTTPAEVKATA